jgi:hypothetical protein
MHLRHLVIVPALCALLSACDRPDNDSTRNANNPAPTSGSTVTPGLSPSSPTPAPHSVAPPATTQPATPDAPKLMPSPPAPESENPVPLPEPPAGGQEPPAPLPEPPATQPGAATQPVLELDQAITDEVRRVLSASTTLSETAKACTIVTERATVTLRGEVETLDEKDEIAILVRTVPGVAGVNNLLEVQPPPPPGD